MTTASRPPEDSAPSPRGGSTLRRSPLRRQAANAARVLVTAALLVAAGFAFDWSAIGHTLGRADPVTVAAAFAAYLAAALAMALRWRTMLRRDGADLRLSTCYRLYLESFLVGLVLPSFFGGDAYRAVRVRRRMPSIAGAAVNVVAERGIGALALGALAAIGLLAHPVARLSFGGRAAIVAGLLAAAGLSVVLYRLGAGLVRRIGVFDAIRARVRPYAEQARAYLLPWRAGAPLLLLSTTAHVLGAVSTWLAALAVGIELGPSFYIVLLPALWLLSLVPALGGVGPKEGGLILALVEAGATAEAASAAALLTLAARLFASLLGGISLLASPASR